MVKFTNTLKVAKEQVTNTFIGQNLEGDNNPVLEPTVHI